MTKKTPIYYDDPKFDYQEYWQGREYENQSEILALNKLLHKLPHKRNLLDIGGGFGRLTPIYAPIFRKCLLVDPSQKLLSEADELCKKYKNFTVKKAFIEKLPFKDHFFDAVISVRTFHHLQDPNQAIKEISRITRPGGFFVIEFANKNRFINILRSVIRGNFNFLIEIKPVDISLKRNSAPFLSYHPSQIKTLLLTNGFNIEKVLSVGNFRSNFLKKIIPLKVLLFLDSLIFFLNIRFSLLNYFGPSIFILAQKSK